MIKYGNIPLRTKLISIQVITALVVILFSTTYFVSNDIKLIKEYKATNLTSVTRVIGMNSASALLFNDKQAAEITLGYFNFQDDILNATIFDSNGKEFASYTKKGQTKYTFSRVPSGETTEFQDDNLFVYSPIKDDKTLGTICVRAELSQLNQIIFKVIMVAITVIFIASVIAFFLSAFLQKSISGPIFHLLSVMKRIIKTGDYSIRIPKALEGKDEIGVLAVTSNNLLERVQESKSALEIHVKDLDNFAYVVSHDLKAPLRGISSLAQFIKEDYYDKIGEEGREQLSILQNKVGKMNNLIDGILLYSREGRKKSDKSNVNVNELIKEVIDLLSPADNVRITTRNKLPELYTNKTSLQQVFQNLISNAIKYNDKPVAEIKIGSQDHSWNYYKFQVSDNGMGIDKKYFPKIFQLFQTLSSDDNKENTGVGLAIVKKVVENYGGEIWVESELEKGSTFFFTWPKS